MSDLQLERRNFEEWANEPGHPEGGYRLDKTASGAYINPETRCAWRGWLGRAEIATPAPSERKMEVFGYVDSGGMFYSAEHGPAPFPGCTTVYRAARRPAPTAPTMVCSKCGAHRFKEDCKGDRMQCDTRGTAQTAPSDGTRHKVPCASYEGMTCATPAWCNGSGCKVAQGLSKPAANT